MDGLVDLLLTPVPCHYTSNAASDAWVASDMPGGVSLSGVSEVLFLIAHPAVIGESAAGAQVQVQYSSTGSASDAATSNATMSCTDAIITFTTAVNGAAGLYTLLFCVDRKAGFDTGAGKLFTEVRCDSTATLEIMAVPLMGTGRKPGIVATVVADD